MSEPLITRALSERQLKADGSDNVAFQNREAIPLIREMRTALNERNGRGFCSYQHAGGSGLEAWYWANYPLSGGTTIGSPTANVLRAYPFVAPARPSSVDRIAFEVTTLAAGNGRVGLWTNTADDNLYPDALLADGGSISTGTTGVKSATVDVPLVSGQLYWLSLVTSAAPALRTMQLYGLGVILGLPSTLGPFDNVGIYVAYAFAALPDTFPAGGAYLTNADTNPALAYRLA